MPSIDISTTQNVTIEYELATWRDRALAGLLDFFIYLLGSAVLAMFLAIIFEGDLSRILIFVLITPLVAFYSLFCEMLFEGQTIGKKALHIRVVKLSGEVPNFSDYFARWSLRFLEIWLTFGGLASLLATSSANGQRLGDLLAGTTVIRLRASRVFTLQDILSIQSRSNYVPRYPEAAKFSEKDMLFIKIVVDRYRRYPNQAHLEAVEALSDQVAQKLDFPQTPQDRIGFLRTLINDYIVLTR